MKIHYRRSDGKMYDFGHRCGPTPLAGDWGYAGQKIRFGLQMEFSEAG